MSRTLAGTRTFSKGPLVALQFRCLDQDMSIILVYASQLQSDRQVFPLVLGHAVLSA